MHVAFLTPEFPINDSAAYGGIGTSMKSLVQGLRSEGVLVTVFLIGQNHQEIIEQEGVTLHRIAAKKYWFCNWYFNKKRVQAYVKNIVANSSIDLIEAPDWSGITAFINLRVPLVIRFHGTDAYFCELEGRKQKAKNFWLEKIALKNADALTSVSEFTAVRTKELFNLKKEVVVIPNGIDTQIFQPQSDRLESSHLLYFGSIIRKKGVLDLVSIFNLLQERIPGIELKVAGKDVVDITTGKSTRELMEEQLSLQAKKNIKFLGSLDYLRMREEIDKAAVVVFPSYAEALPMAWIESMAMGKSMVTSDIGWSKEVVQDGISGFTVHPKNHSAYADKIIQLLQDKDLKNEMETAARKRALSLFSLKKVTTQNIQFYKSILNVQ